jgi:hypothetical protein
VGRDLQGHLHGSVRAIERYFCINA